MRTANEYRQKQVLSLKDEISKLLADIQSIREERSQWESGKKQREEVLSGIEQSIVAAEEVRDAKIKSLDTEIGQKQERVKELENRVSNLESWHSHQAAEKSAEMIEVDLKIDEKRTELRRLRGEEKAIKVRITQAKSDEVSALQSTAKALDENRSALGVLSKTKERIIQAEKDWKAGEYSRAAEANSLKKWENHLNTRESDFNIVVERLKPEFVQVFGETKINEHIFKPSKPTKV